jgi:hypothetical protein
MSVVKIHCTLGLNLLFRSAIYNRKCAYLSFGNSTPPQVTSAQFFRLWQLEMKKCRRFVETTAPWKMPVRQSLVNLRRCGAFIAAFTSEK